MHNTLLGIKEFHISRKSRDFYKFDESIYSINGNVVLGNFLAARKLAQKMNIKRNLSQFPERAVRASQINAMGLIDEIMHIIMSKYQEMLNPSMLEGAIRWLTLKIGEEQLHKTLLQFVNEFPPIGVYKQQLTSEEYLLQVTQLQDGRSILNRELVLEELILLWIANKNPANFPFTELFDDSDLEKNTYYTQVLSNLREYFDSQPFFGPNYQNLIDMLRSPAIAHPHSLSDQLEFIRRKWGYLLGDILSRLLRSLDLIKEEERVIFGFGGGGASSVYDFSQLDLETERFSKDLDWMPQLVLMAKNTFVWLDQLSKKYKQAINRLDQIPDSELDHLAASGFTGLWLIGVWERSNASKRIKQMRGNPEAVASAYSLYGYDIAGDLGGYESFKVFQERAWHRGIRLASDMVPNHMGIDSPWVLEHPEWFISLGNSPFPAYSFSGENLSGVKNVGIFIEDHYFDNSDAAVVFKRVDFWSGDEKFIYHGNDGTSMPWNDTAQLDYLKPEVRESVIQTILHVARQFPIIRFDAAMTLAKRHYQRLWYPEPGSGGDIPSRSEYGMTKSQFDQQFPEEFWREVVDRVAQEVPNTLLLAEAFWLMEGFFVRTLGMHRVYNSAFMNMLRDEKNQEYRLVIKNTMEFDPEILKRFVNFMSNPDERTAVDQFGKGDKYFGVCTMMVTMPGLPMFGHGQIEGFTEKYGMEYRRAYWDEQPDIYLIDRHEREIFPLLKQRYLFADANNFRLYDFFTAEGYVDENVFAYSNSAGGQLSLVIYHNKYAETRGWIKLTSAYPVKQDGGTGSDRIMIQSNLGDELHLVGEENNFIIFRDHSSGLEYIRNSKKLRMEGLYLELPAYKYHVFLDFYSVQDDEQGRYNQLEAFLDGRGVPNIDASLRELILEEIRHPYAELVNSGMLKWLFRNRLGTVDFDLENYKLALDEVFTKAERLSSKIKNFVNGTADTTIISELTKMEIEIIFQVAEMLSKYPEESASEITSVSQYLSNGPENSLPFTKGDKTIFAILFIWAFTHRLGFILEFPKYVSVISDLTRIEDEYQDQAAYFEQSRTWVDEWMLDRIIRESLTGLGMEEIEIDRSLSLIKILITKQGWLEGVLKEQVNVYRALQSLLEDDQVRKFIQLNRYKEVLWFNKESFEKLLWWLLIVTVIRICEIIQLRSEPGVGEISTLELNSVQILVDGYYIINQILAAQKDANYQLDKLLEMSIQIK